MQALAVHSVAAVRSASPLYRGAKSSRLMLVLQWIIYTLLFLTLAPLQQPRAEDVTFARAGSRRIAGLLMRGGRALEEEGEGDDGGEDDGCEGGEMEVVIKSSSSSSSSSSRRRKTTTLPAKGVLKTLLKQLYNFLRPYFQPTSTQSRSSKGSMKRDSKSSGAKKAQSHDHLEKSFKTGDPSARVQKELRSFLANPPEQCKLQVGANMRSWVVTMVGAQGTIYAGESYKLKLIFPKEYPSKPPSVYFLKPCPRHMHVYSNGDICLNLLGPDWRPTMTAQALVVSILSMLSSAKEKKLPQDNSMHADNPPGQEQLFLYHDDRC